MGRIILILFLFYTTLLSHVLLEDNTSVYKDFTLEYFYDAENRFTINTIEEQSFSKTTSNKFTFGYLTGTTWFKITLKNISDNEDFVLSFNEALWKKFDLYYRDGREWNRDRNGLDIELDERSIRNVTPAFALQLKHNTTQTYYIEAQTIASQIGYFEIYTEKEFFNPSRFSITHIYIIFSFMLIILIILNLYNYLLTHQKIYIYYMLYMMIFILFSSMQSGIYMFLGFSGWNEGLHVVGTFVNISLILFTNNFLELKSKLPIVYTFFNISIGVFLLFALLISQNVPYSELLFNLYSIPFFLTLFITAIKIYVKGSLDAKYYLIALMIYTPSMSLMILNFNAFLDYSLSSRHIYLLGSLIEILFFTLVLTNKYRNLYLEKIQIQKQLIDEKRKYEEVLESEISERTSELEQAHEKLEKMAITDNLTQLYNRYKVDQVLLSEYEHLNHKGQTFSIILMDVDHFKDVNDDYGHPVGDIVLVELAKLLRSSIRKGDILARWGGEEFIIICKETDSTGAKKLAENVRSIVSSHIFEPVGKITLSFGICEHQAGNSSNETIKCADDALYEAKNTGRNCVKEYTARE